MYCIVLIEKLMAATDRRINRLFSIIVKQADRLDNLPSNCHSDRAWVSILELDNDPVIGVSSGLSVLNLDSHIDWRFGRESHVMSFEHLDN